MKKAHLGLITRRPQLAISINDLTEAQNLMAVVTMVLSFLNSFIKALSPPEA